jgi:alpha-L-fucosidase
MIKIFCVISFLFIFITPSLRCQTASDSSIEKYVWPSDSLVKKNLDHWQDLKFGIIIHWGLYSVPGIVESWGLCSEDWVKRDSNISYCDYKKWYWGLSKVFDPVKFDPEAWAKVAKDAGMRYLVFTTKHHDGFCMFDTKQTDFKITNGPFKNNPRANVAKYVFQAFRNQGFMIGAYFSKPDWHSKYYWWPMYATPNRNNNYDIRKYPWRWDRFKEFTYNQISELMHGYGKIDILWLDGGWVRPLDTVTPEVRSWGAPIPPWSQDINMPHIAAMARKAQPGILIVDRTVHGKYENYRTPEQTIPDTKLDYPWESCVTLGNAWGYVPHDHYKTPAKVIHMLIEVAAKGGNLLLGIGPKGDGTLVNSEVVIMKEIGNWLKVNGKAIYNTRPANYYRDGETFFTQSKDGDTCYALVRLPENKKVPDVVEWTGNYPKNGTAIKLLCTREDVRWTRAGNEIKAFIPSSFVKNHENYPALAFSFEVQR